MKLRVPLVFQDKGSDDCGIACLSMLLAYYGTHISMRTLKKDIRVFPKIGTYGPQLGIFFLDHGFEATIVTLNPRLFTMNDKRLNQKGILERMQTLLTTARRMRDKRVLRFFIAFLQKGGRVEVALPSAQHIRREIQQKRPVIPLLTSNYLLGKQPYFNSHFNVITGIDNKFVYVQDPLSDYRGGKQKYKISDYLYGIYAGAYGDWDNASLLLVRKR